MKKRLILLVLSLLAAFLLAACGGAETEEAPQEAAQTEPAETQEPVYHGYEAATVTVNDLDAFVQTGYFDTAASLAPKETAETIRSQTSMFKFASKGDLCDFRMYLGDGLFHFLAAADSNPEGKIGAVHGAFRADDTAPYYLASLLSWYQGLPEDEALAAAQEAIRRADAGEDMDNPCKDIFMLKVNGKGDLEYYYALLLYSQDYKAVPYYQTTLSSNLTDIAAFESGFVQWGS